MRVRKNKNLRHEKYVSILSVTVNDRTKLYPIIKKRYEQSQDIQEIYLIKKSEDVFNLKDLNDSR